MKKTKIICTIGPASANEETLTKMCLAGMNVARMNFSHGTHEEQLYKIELVKKVREKLNLPIAILLDTKGPEFRTGSYVNGSVQLTVGQKFTLYNADVLGDENGVSVSYKNLYAELKKGDTVLINNGLVVLKVDKIVGKDVVCTVESGKTLSDKKSMAFPGKHLKINYLSEQDKADIAFGVKNDVDFIACSFVSCKQDLVDVKNYLAELGAKNVDVIAKIENESGVNNIDEICEACEGIMVARGDLGVEIPYETLPTVQKQLISKCRLNGKRVITATEMLESMIYNVRPTRAEISDVANAVYDGSSSIMLSGETAAGKYPVEAVKAMAKIAEEAEKSINYSDRFYTSKFNIKNLADAISHSTCNMAMDIGAKGIVACTISGITARMISRFRPPVPVIAVTSDKKAWRKLALSWGVIPAMCKMYNTTDEVFSEAERVGKEVLGLTANDRLVLTCGVAGVPGQTDTIKVVTTK